ncbi:ketosteroid isomerase-related protein [Granulicella sp. dw_53]|uniref:ester cyclase n=1 Tax=Granulicella sp. dw_53 TaxID=2719792 RepID=UPI001BD563B4|nr:ketosteroid isomerase-related protein [Granulicella sp. dw_53]
MSSEILTSVLEDWASLWSTSDAAERFISLFTDDCVYEDVALEHVMNGKSEIQHFYQQTRSAFPDFKVTLESQMATGSQGAVQWLMTGTQLGDFPGIPATKKYVSVRGASIFELHEGKIKGCRDYYNLAAMFKQLGV